MTPFKKYESISRATNLTSFEFVKLHNKENNWYATEKIHGTNFSFILGEGPVKYAQRTQITDSIFGSHLYVDSVQGKLEALQRHLNRPIQVYGEFFGPGIISTSDAIKYDNDKAFIFFDIRFIDTGEFCDYPLNFELFDQFEIPRVPVIGEGSLEELVKISTNFKSSVSKLGEMAEGYVLKPNKTVFIADFRMVLKMINPNFDDQKKKGPDLEIAKQKQIDFDLLPELEEKINMVRVGKVAAKLNITPANINNFSHLLNGTVADIESEMELTPKIKKVLVSKVSPFIKQFFNPTT